MRTALIDADVLVYEAGLANEYEIQWDTDNWCLYAEFTKSVADLADRIEMIKRNLQCDDVVMALTDYTDPWRQKVMPTYKAKRAKLGARKPVVHAPLRQFIHQEYRTYQRPGLEGDDILGILITHPSIVEGEKIIVSIDKDMGTLPGQHVKLQDARKLTNWMDAIVTVSEDEASYFHLLQTLMGDKTDGYDGIPGIGPKKAEKILDGVPPSEAWPVIVAAYEKAGLNEAVALANARVARILRHNEYDFQKKEVKLWHP